jgi:hypothetical protein
MAAWIGPGAGLLMAMRKLIAPVNRTALSNYILSRIRGLVC